MSEFLTDPRCNYARICGDLGFGLQDKALDKVKQLDTGLLPDQCEMVGEFNKVTKWVGMLGRAQNHVQKELISLLKRVEVKLLAI